MKYIWIIMFLTMSDINCMVMVPTQEEIDCVSQELEKMTLRYPEMVWEPIEDNPCDVKAVRSFDKGA